MYTNKGLVCPISVNSPNQRYHSLSLEEVLLFPCKIQSPQVLPNPPSIMPQLCPLHSSLTVFHNPSPWIQVGLPSYSIYNLRINFKKPGRLGHLPLGSFSGFPLPSGRADLCRKPWEEPSGWTGDKMIPWVAEQAHLCCRSGSTGEFVKNINLRGPTCSDSDSKKDPGLCAITSFPGDSNVGVSWGITDSHTKMMSALRGTSEKFFSLVS